MSLDSNDLVIGKTYVLTRDFIQTPQIRHNFGTEVIFLGHISSDLRKVMVKVKGAVSGGFMVPVSILKEQGT